MCVVRCRESRRVYEGRRKNEEGSGRIIGRRRVIGFRFGG